MKKEEAIKIVKNNWPEGRLMLQEALQTLIPELKESENERIRKVLIKGFQHYDKACKWGEFTTTEILSWLEKQGEPQDKGEISDGYHTFNELYYYRMLYNAAFFNMLPKEWVHKSKKHNDGEECFGGGWFIVMANLPTGQISNHYELKDWDLFQIPEKEVADKWDGHTPKEATERLHKYLLEKQSKQESSLEAFKAEDDVRRQSTIQVLEYARSLDAYNQYGKASINKNIAWLEKQGMQKPAWSEDDKEQLDRAICMMEQLDMTKSWDDVYDWLKSLKYRVLWLQPKKCEQKPTDKVKPKFNVGDTMRTLQEAIDGYTCGMPVIISIDDEYYHCTNELIPIKYQDYYEFPPINVKQKSTD